MGATIATGEGQVGDRQFFPSFRPGLWATNTA
jgi:hypothetical protein